MLDAFTQLNRHKLWTATDLGAAGLAGGAARALAKLGWRAATRRDPPNNPASSDVTWREAIAWTVALGVLVGVARLATRRVTTAAWTRVTGRKPPV